MALLKASLRNALMPAQFALPAQRKYPIPDKSHAANAKARATQMVEAGKLAPGTASTIDTAANRVLKR